MKITLLALVFAVLIAMPAFAVLDANNVQVNITLNYPTNRTYNASGVTNPSSINFNATVTWASSFNLTNVTFILIQGSTTTRYTNSTGNGSRTSATSGDFTFNVTSTDLTEGEYTVVAEAINRTGVDVAALNATNSSYATYTIDRTPPSVLLSNPLSGSVVVPSNNIIVFEYTPTEANLGNCTLHLNNQAYKSSTSGNLQSNVTTNTLNRFRQGFTADNSSIRTVVQCVDLAGQIGTSSNFTFGVILGAASPYARERAAAGGGGGAAFATQQGFTGVSQSAEQSFQQASTHVQRYAWIYLIAFMAVLFLLYKKFKR